MQQQRAAPAAGRQRKVQAQPKGQGLPLRWATARERPWAPVLAPRINKSWLHLHTGLDCLANCVAICVRHKQRLHVVERIT